MKGFFKKEDTQSLTVTQSRKMSCTSCGLFKEVKSPKMEPYGKFKKKIMVIGEAPGEREDRNGKPWQGKTGRLLQKTLKGFGIDLFKDCLSLNAVNCRPPGNRAPSPNELNCCRDVKVLKTIVEYKPKMVLLLGGEALKSFLVPRWKGRLDGITKWRGWTIPDQDYKCWVCPTFHPSYVQRIEGNEALAVWKQDLERALIVGFHPFPKYVKPNIHYIEDLEELFGLQEGMAAFDFETKGLKPHADGQRIICVSIAYNENDVVVFPMPKRKSKRKPFIDFLESDVKKIAANMKFEDHWSNIRLKTRVNNWHHDIMIQAHILDNRPGISGLKFQACVQLGIIDYDSEVSPYLEATKEDKKKYGANAINRIHELIEQEGGMKKLLEYCALDSIYEYRIAMIQKDQMIERTLPF